MTGRRLISKAVRQIEVESFDLGPLPDDGILVENEYTVVSIGTEIYGWTHGGEPGGPPRIPRTTGYCSVGRVAEVGSQVEGVKPGDRVSGQGNHTSHSILRPASGYQIVPGDVDVKSAAFMVMAAIALHGVRVASVELGSSIVILGPAAEAGHQPGVSWRQVRSRWIAKRIGRDGLPQGYSSSRDQHPGGTPAQNTRWRSYLLPMDQNTRTRACLTADGHRQTTDLTPSNPQPARTSTRCLPTRPKTRLGFCSTGRAKADRSLIDREHPHHP